MSYAKNQIIAIQEKTNVKDFSNVTNEEFKHIQNMVVNKSLSQQELMALTQLIPNFIELQKDYIDGIKSIAQSAGNAQMSAFSVIDSQMRVLETLARNAQTDEARIKIAEIVRDISEKTNKIVSEMNSDNNSFWKNLATMAVGIAAIGVGIFVSKGKS